LIIAIRRNR